MAAVLITGNCDDRSTRDEIWRLLTEHSPEVVINGGRIGAEYQGRAWARARNRVHVTIPKPPRRDDLEEYSIWDGLLTSAVNSFDCKLVIATAGARWPLVACLRERGISVIEINPRQGGLFG